MDIRCVVTGQNTSGKSVVVRDVPVAPITVGLLPGFEFHRLWGSESVVQLPSNGTAPPHPGYFPPKTGFRFGFFTMPPEADSELSPADLAAAFGELREKLPGMAEVLEPEHPGMHTTDTVDFDVIVSGEVYLELEMTPKFCSRRETAWYRTAHATLGTTGPGRTASLPLR